ncbi:MAG: GNAT family N-acetyltransferase [Candidatus Buchananbacteria bacterium]|nr:GNAT family N-acetyltransferase [Candidatus Buchananbacteria bacterium]
MTESSLKVRPAVQADSRRVWEIRNHPQVREVSGNPQAFSFESHNAWFENKYFSAGDNRCYVLEVAEVVSGYCRLDFDQQKKWYVISIALDPELQGRGLGNYLLQEVIKNFDRQVKIFAEIKKTNAPSLKLFEKNGFKIFDEDENNFYLNYGE